MVIVVELWYFGSVRVGVLRVTHYTAGMRSFGFHVVSQRPPRPTVPLPAQCKVMYICGTSVSLLTSSLATSMTSPQCGSS